MLNIIRFNLVKQGFKFLTLATILSLSNLQQALSTKRKLDESQDPTAAAVPKIACVSQQSVSARASAFADDLFFSDPAFLTSIDQFEQNYRLQKNGQSAQPSPSNTFEVNLLRHSDSHQNHLLSSINTAKKSILITSYNFSANLKHQLNLFEALRAASLKNVKIYIYFHKDDGLNDAETDYLVKTGIRLCQMNIHSKLLVIDHSSIACGSFDWLTDNSYRQLNQEASLVVQEKNLGPFVNEIWETLKKYKELGYRPDKLAMIDRKFSNTDSIILSEDTNGDIADESCELLTTPQQHDSVLLQSLCEAHHNITLCAPFITRDPNYLMDIFPKDLLQGFLKANKILHIYYRVDDENFVLLRQYLADLAFPNLILTPIKNLHRKTLIADDTYIEGSFNWLSSARTLEDDFHYMETSLVLNGPKARVYINDFNQSMRS